MTSPHGNFLHLSKAAPIQKSHIFAHASLSSTQQVEHYHIESGRSSKVLVVPASWLEREAIWRRPVQHDEPREVSFQQAGRPSRELPPLAHRPPLRAARPRRSYHHIL